MSEPGGFFSFRSLITTPLIRFVYAAGAALMTVGGIGLLLVSVITAFENVSVAKETSNMPLLDAGLSNPAAGIVTALLLLTFGNILWRMACESWILFFSTHEMLVSVEHEMRNGRKPATLPNAWLDEKYN